MPRPATMQLVGWPAENQLPVSETLLQTVVSVSVSSVAGSVTVPVCVFGMQISNAPEPTQVSVGAGLSIGRVSGVWPSTPWLSGSCPSTSEPSFVPDPLLLNEHAPTSSNHASPRTGASYSGSLVKPVFEISATNRACSLA